MSDKGFVPASGENFLVRKTAEGSYRVSAGKVETTARVEAQVERIDAQTQRVLTPRGLFWVFASRGKRVLSWPGGSIALDCVDLGEASAGGAGKLKPLKLTMPGKVVSVKVKAGDVVEAGQGLVIVEAMKMENLLQAPARAKVAKVHVAEGDRLESGATLVSFESAE